MAPPLRAGQRQGGINIFTPCRQRLGAARRGRRRRRWHRRHRLAAHQRAGALLAPAGGQRQGGINIFTPIGNDLGTARRGRRRWCVSVQHRLQVRRFTTSSLTNADADRNTTVLQTNDGPGDLACATDLVRVGDVTAFTEGNGSVDSAAEFNALIALPGPHGVTEFTAGLEYHNQPGALNESISDVFGSLVKRWFHRQTAADADWLIGADVFTPGIEAYALRSMKEPGKAYDNELFGKDPQPDHMSRYMHLPDNFLGDFGGVHIKSGIPNKAFYLTAMDIGGYAWEAPEHIWYEALKASNVPTQFHEFANLTYAKAGELYGAPEQQSVLTAWRKVGMPISVPLAAAATARARAATGREADTLAALSKQIEGLATQMKAVGILNVGWT